MQIDEKMQGNYPVLVNTTSQQDAQQESLSLTKKHTLQKTLST
jgi:hypothetical protein